jgi:hypothetical protein
VWACFHRAWTACVGTPGYDKAAWKAVEAQLIIATTPRPKKECHLARALAECYTSPACETCKGDGTVPV